MLVVGLFEMAYFEVRKKDRDGVRRHRVEGDAMTIGRSSANDIVLRDNAVSRRHALLDFEGDVVRIRDIDSRHGLKVNKTHVDQAVLSDGDSIRLGPYTLTYHAEEHGESARGGQPAVSADPVVVETHAEAGATTATTEDRAESDRQDSRIDTLQTAYSTMRDQLDDLAESGNEQSSLRARIDEVAEQVDALRAEVSGGAAGGAQLTDLLQRLEEVDSRLIHLGSEHKSHRQLNERLDALCNRFDTPRSDDPRVEELQTSMTELSAKLEEIAGRWPDRANMTAHQAAFDNIGLRLTNLASAHDEQQHEVQRRTNDLDTRLEAIESLQSQVEDLTTRSSELSTLLERVESRCQALESAQQSRVEADSASHDQLDLLLGRVEVLSIARDELRDSIRAAGARIDEIAQSHLQASQAASAQQAQHGDQIRAIEAQLTGCLESIEQLDRNVADEKETREQLQRRMISDGDRVGEIDERVASQIDALSRTIGNVEEGLAALRQDLDGAQRRCDGQDQRLAEIEQTARDALAKTRKRSAPGYRNGASTPNGSETLGDLAQIADGCSEASPEQASASLDDLADALDEP